MENKSEPKQKPWGTPYLVDRVKSGAEIKEYQQSDMLFVHIHQYFISHM